MIGRQRVSLLLFIWLCSATPFAWQAWPPSRPPGPLRARPVEFPQYQLKTLSNGLQVVVLLHHEQPSVSFRLLVRAGAVQETGRQAGRGELRRRAPQSGHDDEVGGGHRQPDRLGRRQHRRRVRQRADVPRRRGHQGSDRPGAEPGVGHRAEPGVRAGGDRAPAQPDRLGAEGQLRRSGLPRQSHHRQDGLRRASVRPAE